MSMNGRVTHEVRAIFSESLKIDVPDDTTDLIEGGLIDSLALVELILEVEQRFGTSIPLDTLDIDDFRTVERIGAVIAATEAGSQ